MSGLVLRKHIQVLSASLYLHLRLLHNQQYPWQQLQQSQRPLAADKLSAQIHAAFSDLLVLCCS